MSDISKIDKNFSIAKADEKDKVFYNVCEPPFRVYGLLSEPDGFRRLPASVAKTVNKQVDSLADHTAGGRVRFVTDSEEINIRAKLRNISRFPHMTLTGSAGFDLYADNEYMGSFVPPYTMEEKLSGRIKLNGRATREITINFPPYSGVTELQIGVFSDCVPQAPREYTISTPVVYYGSSITQGGCASRPGNCYQQMITRRLDCDHINLGFSSGAMGEDEIAEYIAGLSMSAFVYDYDWNAKTLSDLEATHERMFKIIRKKHPTLPVVMASRPNVSLNAEEMARREVVRATYLNARNAGDENVYFIDGQAMMQPGGDGCTVDHIHPNDLGFFCMAKAIGDVLEKILL